jgi:hypothetical protein
MKTDESRQIGYRQSWFSHRHLTLESTFSIIDGKYRGDGKLPQRIGWLGVEMATALRTTHSATASGKT